MFLLLLITCRIFSNVRRSKNNIWPQSKCTHLQNTVYLTFLSQEKNKKVIKDCLLSRWRVEDV